MRCPSAARLLLCWEPSSGVERTGPRGSTGSGREQEGPQEAGHPWGLAACSAALGACDGGHSNREAGLWGAGDRPVGKCWPAPVVSPGVAANASAGQEQAGSRSHHRPSPAAGNALERTGCGGCVGPSQTRVWPAQRRHPQAGIVLGAQHVQGTGTQEGAERIATSGGFR